MYMMCMYMYMYMIEPGDKWKTLRIHTCTCILLTVIRKCIIFHEQYLAWRVLIGLHRTVTMSFMLVGHTKFAPDWCFGLFKQRYRRTFVSSLEDVAEVVKVSADVNVAQLVGTQSGQPIVPVYDWVNFFAGRFRSIPQLKSFQHFIFSSAHPGIVVLKAYSDSSETRFTMLNDDTWSPSTSMLPQTIRPSGLPLARQWYLYRQIRDYCRDGTEDLTCPKPSDPLDTTSQGSDRQQELSEEEESGSTAHPPPAKKLRRCGKCGETGHTRRSCKHH